MKVVLLTCNGQELGIRFVVGDTAFDWYDWVSGIKYDSKCEMIPYNGTYRAVKANKNVKRKIELDMTGLSTFSFLCSQGFRSLDIGKKYRYRTPLGFAIQPQLPEGTEIVVDEVTANIGRITVHTLDNRKYMVSVHEIKVYRA